MRIELRSPVPVRQYLRVESDQYGLLGMASVRYCNREGIKHFTGLEFSGMRSSPRWRSPSPAKSISLEPTDRCGEIQRTRLWGQAQALKDFWIARTINVARPLYSETC